MRMRVGSVRSRLAAVLTAVAVVISVGGISVTYGCSKLPKPVVAADAQHDYDTLQLVRVVNDATTVAITANHTGHLSDNGERWVLTVNKQVLDYVGSNPDTTRVKVLTAIRNGLDAVPAAVRGEVAAYVQTVVDFLNNVNSGSDNSTEVHQQ